MEHKKKTKKKRTMSSCTECTFYVWDEEAGYYFCNIDLDEDEYEKFLTGRFNDCPYYRSGDEYELARKQ